MVEYLEAIFLILVGVALFPIPSRSKHSQMFNIGMQADNLVSSIIIIFPFFLCFSTYFTST